MRLQHLLLVPALLALMIAGSITVDAASKKSSRSKPRAVPGAGKPPSRSGSIAAWFGGIVGRGGGGNGGDASGRSVSKAPSQKEGKSKGDGKPSGRSKSIFGKSRGAERSESIAKRPKETKKESKSTKRSASVAAAGGRNNMKKEKKGKRVKASFGDDSDDGHKASRSKSKSKQTIEPLQHQPSITISTYDSPAAQRTFPPYDLSKNGGLPKFFLDMLDEIEEPDKIIERDIYRSGDSASTVAEIIKAIKTSGEFDYKSTSAADLAAVVKRFLSSLTSTLISLEVVGTLREALGPDAKIPVMGDAKLHTDVDENAMIDAIRSIEEPQKTALLRLLRHFVAVLAHGSENGQTPIGIVSSFGPSLLPFEVSHDASVKKKRGQLNQVAFANLIVLAGDKEKFQRMSE